MPMTMLTHRQVPAAIRAAVSGGRSREAVLATDQAVEVYDQRSGRVILEVLMLEGAEWSEPLPMLRDHATTMPNQIGSATNVRREPGKLAATLHFARNDAGNDAWQLVTDGHARSVSVGYRILEQTELRAGQTKTVSGRLFTAPADRPLRVVSRWALKEVSVVVIPADEKAGIRSFPSLSERTNPVPASTMLSAIPGRQVDAMRLIDLAALTLRSRDQVVPDNPNDLLELAFPTRGRAGTSGVGGVDELLNIITTWALDGWRRAGDSLEGIYSILPASSYLEERIASIKTHPRLARLARGEVAPSVSFSVDSTTTQLMKFGAKFCLAEEDALDGAELGVWRIAIEESLRAARAMVADLLWSVILTNPTLSDGEPLFSAGRNNLSNTAFSNMTLKLAWGAIGSQVGTDEDGLPIHYGLEPRYLIVAPQGLIAAREYVRPGIVSGLEIIPRAESRLTTTGFVNPVTNELLAVPNNNHWLLCCPAEQKASIALSVLGGRTEPVIRQSPLRQGSWGTMFDISFSCVAAALDGRPLYLSTSDG